MSKIKIREGKLADISAVFELVFELAIFEKSQHEVTNSPEKMSQDFLAGNFELLIAQNDNEIVGIAIFHPAYSSWKGLMYYLDDIVIRQSHRNKGIGSMLFETLILKVKEKDAKILKWQVLDWNVQALNFYQKYNAIIEKDWWNGKLIFE